jgi:curved DNA-binding protein
VSDHYSTLGVGKSASADEVRAAFRKLARQLHPDVNPGADAAKRFAKVQQAYEVLSDNEKRAMYDQFGDAAFAPGAAAGGHRPRGAPAGWSSRSSARGRGSVPDFDAQDLGSIFESIFGGGQGGRSNTRAGAAYDQDDDEMEESVHEARVDFMLAAKGGTHSVRVPTAQETFKTIEVRIPAGTDDGAGLRVRGALRGLQQGASDLLLRVRVLPHELFRRGEHASGKGLDIFFDLPITIAEATLGASVQVPTLQGTVQLRVPAGTASGKRLMLRGMGIRDDAGRQGDCYAIVQIVPPSDAGISDLEQDVLRRIAGLGGNPRSSAAWQRSS